MLDTKGISSVLAIILYMPLYKWSLFLETSFPIANPIQNNLFTFILWLRVSLTATCQQGYMSIQLEK